MKTNLFSCKDYKVFLRLITRENTKNRGFKRDLAFAAEIQPSYLSQVLTGKQHLSQDQAMGVSQFFGFNEIERQYFFELIQYNKSVSKSYKMYAEKRLEQFRLESENLSKRLEKTGLEDGPRQALYYSSWLWSAIHILLTIPEYQTVKALNAKLNMNEVDIQTALFELENIGLAKKEGANKWSAIMMDLHLPKDSPFNSINHQNWRMKAVTDSANKKSEGIHYTIVASLSRYDAEKLKEEILEFISRSRKTIVASKEEECHTLCIDWFKV